MARKPSPKPKRAVPIDEQGKRKPRGQMNATQAKPHTPLPVLDQLRQNFDSHFAPYIPTIPPEARTFRTGAPTLYRPEYCQRVIDLAIEGHTIGATAGLIGVDRQALNNWADSYPEFASALARAKTLRQVHFEGHLIDIARRGGDSTRMSAIKLALLNVGGEDWKERLTAEHNVTFSWSQLLQESLKQVDEPKAITIEGEVVQPTDDQKD